MVEGEGTRVQLDDPAGTSGVLSGPYRLTDADGETVTGPSGARATFSWSCPSKYPLSSARSGGWAVPGDGTAQASSRTR